MKTFNFISIFLFISLASISFKAQEQTKREYLAENHEILSLDGQNEFKLFDKSFYANNMFLLGEMHGTANSYRVQQLLVDDLKKKINFKYYVIELDYITVVQINKYLETGDEAQLKSVFESYKGSFVYSREYYDIFTHVYKINQKLKEKDRIKFIGIDRFAPDAKNLAFLSDILADVKYKKDSLKVLDKIYSPERQSLTYDAWIMLFENLGADIKNNKKTYQKIFGNRFWEFEFLIDNFVASFPINKTRNVKPLSDEEVENVRDAQMAKNFAAFYQHLDLKNQKIFGFFGREHTYQDSGKRTFWMTARIKSANPKLKIATIALRYMESNFMIPTSFLERQFGTKQEKLFFYGGFQNDNSPFVKAVGIEDLNAIEPEAKVVLFRLNKAKSPYKMLPDLVDEIADGKSTTDYFDYAILLRNSSAATPISEK